MELLDSGSSNEIAAIYHIDTGTQHEAQNIFVHCWSELKPTRVSILNTLYEPLQYPILFPHGVGGWGDVLYLPQNGHWTQIQWYKACLLTEAWFQQFCHLGSEWIVDMYSRVEDQHLDAIRLGKQSKYERFHTMAENEKEEEGDKCYTLPSSFTGLLNIMQVKLLIH